MLDYRESVIRPAWEMVQQESILKRFNFFPSLLATLFLIIIVIYQSAYTYIRVFELQDEFFAKILDLAENAYFWESIVIVALIVLLSIFFAPYSEGGILTIIDRESKEETQWPEKTSFSVGLSGGLRHFLPLFELHNIMGLFKLLSIITFTIFLIRIFGKGYTGAILIVAGVYFLLACIVNMLSGYAKCYVVLERKSAGKSVTASVGMALESISMTSRIYFSLLFVYVRTIIVAMIVLVFPFVASGILAYITLPILQGIALGILALALFVFLIFASHLSSVLEIFIEAVWYYAYKLNKAAGIGWGGHDSHGHGSHGSHDDHSTHGKHEAHASDNHQREHGWEHHAIQAHDTPHHNTHWKQHQYWWEIHHPSTAVHTHSSHDEHRDPIQHEHTLPLNHATDRVHHIIDPTH